MQPLWFAVNGAHILHFTELLKHKEKENRLLSLFVCFCFSSVFYNMAIQKSCLKQKYSGFFILSNSQSIKLLLSTNFSPKFHINFPIFLFFPQLPSVPHYHFSPPTGAVEENCNQTKPPREWGSSAVGENTRVWLIAAVKLSFLWRLS